jgi:hypothetical protein
VCLLLDCIANQSHHTLRAAFTHSTRPFPHTASLLPSSSSSSASAPTYAFPQRAVLLAGDRVHLKWVSRARGAKDGAGGSRAAAAAQKKAYVIMFLWFYWVWFGLTCRVDYLFAQHAKFRSCGIKLCTSLVDQ